MNDLGKKLEKMAQLRAELDSHVWLIFERYIRQEKINFNYPAGWEIEYDEIHFHGSDGCMGCYDPMALDIPLRFFINPDEEFEKLFIQRQKEQQEKEEKDRKAKEASERQEFERLKSKYNT